MDLSPFSMRPEIVPMLYFIVMFWSSNDAPADPQVGSEVTVTGFVSPTAIEMFVAKVEDPIFMSVTVTFWPPMFWSVRSSEVVAYFHELTETGATLSQ